ncbi:hypothetical protein KA529_00425 [Candidatus Saccharibacteria bacterium]|jgi:hypothetical protein|nr:hypothetical protein [Candidatus Saccharibacteria bacterium]
MSEPRDMTRATGNDLVRWANAISLTAVIALVLGWIFLSETARGVTMMAMLPIVTILAMLGQRKADDGWKDLRHVLVRIIPGAIVLGLIILLVSTAKDPVLNFFSGVFNM